MGEVKRYTLWMVSESGCELEPYSEESPDGLYVHHADYAALEAEHYHLKACQENAQLHITGLVAERNAALMQRDKLAQALEDVEREHALLRRMKNCELLRGRGSFGIAVMSDTHAIEWQALDKELQRLIDARHAALAEIKP